MKKIFPLLLCPFLSVCLNPALAQKKQQVKDSSVVIIFQETPAAAAKHKKSSSENNVIKLAPLGFISGAFPLLYERRITDFFTLQLGGGLTNKNYMRAAWVDALDGLSDTKYPWDGDNYYDEADGLYNFDHRTPKMGYLYTVEPRIYFESEAPEGAFLGFQYNFSKFNFQIPALKKTDNGDYTHTGAPVQEHENITDFMVHFGGQQLFDRITFEYSTAIGLRKISGTKYAAHTDGSTLTEGLTAYKDNRINFGIGLKVGYHF
jgi:hypothetical protein